MKPVILVSLYQVEAFGLRSIHGFLKRAGVPVAMVFFKRWSWKEKPVFTPRPKVKAQGGEAAAKSAPPEAPAKG